MSAVKLYNYACDASLIACTPSLYRGKNANGIVEGFVERFRG